MNAADTTSEHAPGAATTGSSRPPRAYLSAHGLDVSSAAETVRAALESKGWQIVRETRQTVQTRGQCRKIHTPLLRECDAFIQLLGFHAGPMLKVDEDDDSIHSLASWEAREAAALNIQSHRMVLADEFPFDMIAVEQPSSARRFQISQRQRIKSAVVSDHAQLLGSLERVFAAERESAQRLGLRPPAAAFSSQPAGAESVTAPDLENASASATAEIAAEAQPDPVPAGWLEKAAAGFRSPEHSAPPKDDVISIAERISDSSPVHSVEELKESLVQAAHPKGSIASPHANSEANEAPRREWLGGESAAGTPVATPLVAAALVAEPLIDAPFVGASATTTVQASGLHVLAASPPAIPLKKETSLLLPRRQRLNTPRKQKPAPRVHAIFPPINPPRAVVDEEQAHNSTTETPSPAHDTPLVTPPAAFTLHLAPSPDAGVLMHHLLMPSERPASETTTDDLDYTPPEIERHILWPSEQPEKDNEGPAPHPFWMSNDTPAVRQWSVPLRIHAIAAVLMLSFILCVALFVRAFVLDPVIAADVKRSESATEGRNTGPSFAATAGPLAASDAKQETDTSLTDRLTECERDLDVIITRSRNAPHSDPRRFTAEHTDTIRDVRKRLFDLQTEHTATSSRHTATALRITCRIASVDVLAGQLRSARNVLLDARDVVTGVLDASHPHALLLDGQLALLDAWEAAFASDPARISDALHSIAAAEITLKKLSERTGVPFQWPDAALASIAGTKQQMDEDQFRRSLLSRFPMTGKDYHFMFGTLIVRKD